MKFIEQIRHMTGTPTGYRRAIPGELAVVSQDPPCRSPNYPTATMYRFQVALEACVMVDDQGPTYEVKSFRHAFTNAVYGPTRALIRQIYPDLLSLRRSVTDQDGWDAINRIAARLDEIMEEETQP